MSKAQFGIITGTVADVIKRVVSDGTKLFSGVEQGTEITIAMRCFWLDQVECARQTFGLMKKIENHLNFY